MNANNSSSDDDDDFDELNESIELRIPGLFDAKTSFKSINKLFVHECQSTGFNILQVVKRFRLDQYQYIKMINFIRSQVAY
jgi:hypothetical protein